MEYLRLFIEIIGYLTTITAILIFFLAVASWFLGVFPLFRRLGVGRWSRKIHIVANHETYESLRTDLDYSGVFRVKNIEHVDSSNLSKIKDATLILVDYKSFSEEEFRKLIQYKQSFAGLVVYFPEFSPENMISPDIMKIINNEPFTTVVNHRGRLINDITVTLLSTGYEKR